MALTRARVVAGDARLAAEIGAESLRETLRATRDPAKLARERARNARADRAEKGDSDPWDLKLVAGGLLDIEFIAQFLILAHARERPEHARRLDARGDREGGRTRAARRRRMPPFSPMRIASTPTRRKSCG